MNFIELIKELILIHCARGPLRCDKCKKLVAKGKKFCLIKAYLKAGKIARPMTQININNEEVFCEYDVEKVFVDENKAKKYAINNGIEIQ
ncbi:MAG: hypothetical protein ACFE8A_04320 [Candidatus Hodarchaeota archaeon]